jgi:16S rRNA (uracil1498-N3)-methyltransferase
MLFEETYFFSETPLEGSFALPEEESRHVSAVLRLKAGDRILITDGKGALAVCEIEKSLAKQTLVRVMEKQTILPELPRVTLAVGLIKKNPFETLVELVSQLPVARIVPMVTERSGLPAEAYQSLLPRLSQKALVALKQSKRANLTEVAAPMTFDDALGEAAKSGYACLFEKASGARERVDAARLAAADSVFAMVGPEGGFSDSEITGARAKGLPILELGNSRLRAEAAGFAAIVTLLTFRGNTA